MIQNILILSALTGAGIFIYNKWIKSDSTENKSNVTGRHKSVNTVDVIYW